MNLLHVLPPGNPAANCFLEHIELVKHSLADLGYIATVSTNTPASAGNIVFGGHLLSAKECGALPADTIVYQMEQLPMFVTPHYLALLRRCKVWDYSERNCEWLRANGVADVHYVPFGYHPAMDRVVYDEDREFDFLFYGAENRRRKYVMSSWWAEDCHVKFLSGGVWGSERDEWIARAKIVPTIHQFQDKVAPIHEMARVFYLMTNRMTVLSEVNPDTEIYPWVKEAIATAPYDDMIRVGLKIARNPSLQKEIALRSHEAIKAHPMTEIIGRGL